MNRIAKFLAVAAVALSIGALSSTTFAQGRGGFRGGFSGGGRQHWGGGWGWGWRGGWWPGWGVSFAYAPYYYDYGYYYPPAAYYPSTAYYAPTTYYAPAVVYGSQPATTYNSSPSQPTVDSSQDSVIDRPLSPTAVDRDDSPPPPPSPPRDQLPPQIQRTDQGQSITVVDVKALAKAGLSDDVIVSHIRNSGAVYHLTTAEIIDMKNNGVNDKVIDFMINTPSASR